MESQEIVSLLDPNTITVVGRRFPHRRFSGVILLSGDLRLTLSDKDVVFFSPVSYFNELPGEFAEDRLFMLLADAPLKPLPQGVSALLFRRRDEWMNSFEMVSQEFRILQRKKEQVLRLTELVNMSGSLKSLVNAAADIVEAPCSVLDTSLSFLAYSDDFPSWAANEEERSSGMVPDHSLDLMRAKGLVSPKHPTDLIVFDYATPDGVKGTNHFSFIHSRNNIVGSISFFTKDGQLRKSRLEMIPAISQIVSIQMQKSSTYLLNKSLYYSHLFRQMEEGKVPHNVDELRLRFSFFGYQLKQFLHILVLDIDQTYLPSEEASALAQRVHPLIPNSIYVVNEEEITFLMSSDEICEESPCDQEKLAAALAEHAIDAGISSIYLNPERTPSYIEEARRAVIVGRKVDPDQRVYPFPRYRLTDLAYKALNSSTAYSYRYPPLIHVIDLDLANGTTLAHTLFEYLQDPGDPGAVAERLFIHKNTLYFRLSKIREIMGRDFKDAETIACIQMTFHTLRLQGKADLFDGTGPSERHRAAQRRIAQRKE